MTEEEAKGLKEGDLIIYRGDGPTTNDAQQENGGYLTVERCFYVLHGGYINDDSSFMRINWDWRIKTIESIWSVSFKEAEVVNNSVRSWSYKRDY